MENKIRYPKIGGLKNAQENLKTILEKEPSEDFVKSINENNQIISEEDKGSGSHDSDQAARPRENEL